MTDVMNLKTPQAGRPVSANWGRDVVRAIRAATPIETPGARVERTPNGTAIVVDRARKTVGAEELFPFKIRYHMHSADNGSWEIYLPWGCAQVGGRACIPLNDPAKDAEGNVELNWYAFEIGDEDSVDVKTIGNITYMAYPVYVCMKAWPHIRATAKREEYESEDEPWYAKSLVAMALEAEFQQGRERITARSVLQYVKAQWTEAWDERGLFALRYDPADPDRASDPNTEWKAMLTNLMVTCGRFQVSSDKEWDVTEFDHVVLKINHKVDGEYSLEVEKEMKKSDDDATYVQLYEMNKGIVTQDTRTNITTMPFFDV